MLDIQSALDNRARVKQTLLRVLLGPFVYLRHRWGMSLLLLSLIGVLTLLTQIGGMLLWVSLPLLARIPSSTPVKRRATQLLVFSMLYLLCILVVLPLLAPLNGRVPLPWLPWFATSEMPLKPVNLGF